jgi:ribonuclease P protein component
MAIQSLKTSDDFDKVFKNGRRYNNRAGTVIVANSNVLRLGMIVGKKHGGAVVRNRIKRLIRGSFRILQSSINRTADVVIMPAPNTYARSSDSMLEFMKELFIKAGIVSNITSPDGPAGASC